MEKIINGIKYVFSHKGKFFVLSLSSLIFTFLLFPFNDLSDLISGKVAEFSRNQLLVQFDNLRLGLFPAPEVEIENVAVDIGNMPTVNVQSLSVSPSPSVLWSKTPNGSLSAKGLFRGDVEISVEPGSKSDAGVQRSKIAVKADKVSLQEIRELARLPVLLKGQVSLNSTAQADLAFQEQPDVDLTLSVDQFELPTSNVHTPMGPLTLPEIKLSTVTLKGKLSQGRFNIDEGVIGREGDELRGTVKGNIGFQIQNQGGITPVIGAYSFDIDMTVKKNFQDKASLFLSFLDQHKTPMPDGAGYKFRISANNTMIPPNISALR